ncbi:hypothetical protein DN752_13905 [Echinicola strongylocentroti]|uniref:Uncharacterized protein n=2 Tax=Echinicola strongylocentroti TaxID=1795355 RepID=A0A2Z4IL79_9BACT|nr:hypothetical protein DN752_13905 [Echinicola strongylocentroti]
MYALLDQFVQETNKHDGRVYLVSQTQPIKYFLHEHGSLAQAYQKIENDQSPLTDKPFKNLVSEKAFREIGEKHQNEVYFNLLKSNQFGIRLIDEPLNTNKSSTVNQYQLASNVSSKDYVITTSKPAFMKNYSIACIFYSCQTKEASTSSLAIYQKVNGKWALTYDFPLEEW